MTDQTTIDATTGTVIIPNVNTPTEGTSGNSTGNDPDRNTGTDTFDAASIASAYSRQRIGLGKNPAHNLAVSAGFNYAIDGASLGLCPSEALFAQSGGNLKPARIRCLD